MNQLVFPQNGSCLTNEHVANKKYKLTINSADFIHFECLVFVSIRLEEN